MSHNRRIIITALLASIQGFIAQGQKTFHPMGYKRFFGNLLRSDTDLLQDFYVHTACT